MFKNGHGGGVRGSTFRNMSSQKFLGWAEEHVTSRAHCKVPVSRFMFIYLPPHKGKYVHDISLEAGVSM